MPRIRITRSSFGVPSVTEGASIPDENARALARGGAALGAGIARFGQGLSQAQQNLAAGDERLRAEEEARSREAGQIELSAATRHARNADALVNFSEQDFDADSFSLLPRDEAVDNVLQGYEQRLNEISGDLKTPHARARFDAVIPAMLESAQMRLMAQYDAGLQGAAERDVQATVDQIENPPAFETVAEIREYQEFSAAAVDGMGLDEASKQQLFRATETQAASNVIAWLQDPERQVSDAIAIQRGDYDAVLGNEKRRVLQAARSAMAVRFSQARVQRSVETDVALATEGRDVDHATASLLEKDAVDEAVVRHERLFGALGGLVSDDVSVRTVAGLREMADRATRKAQAALYLEASDSAGNDGTFSDDVWIEAVEGEAERILPVVRALGTTDDAGDLIADHVKRRKLLSAPLERQLQVWMDSPEPAAKYQAARVLGELERYSTSTLEAALNIRGGLSRETVARGLGISYLTERGVDPGLAVEAVMGATSNLDSETFVRRSARYLENREFGEDNLKFLRKQLRDQSLSGDIADDFENLTRTMFQILGDHKQAQKAAMGTLLSSWAKEDTGGGERWTFKGVTKMYGGDWPKEELEAELPKGVSIESVQLRHVGKLVPEGLDEPKDHYAVLQFTEGGLPRVVQKDGQSMLWWPGLYKDSRKNKRLRDAFGVFTPLPDGSVTPFDNQQNPVTGRRR